MKFAKSRLIEPKVRVLTSTKSNPIKTEILTMTVKANWIDLYSHYNTHTMQYILGV